MKKAPLKGKVIWAVDANPEDKRLQFKAAKALAKLTKGTGLAIEPVSVLSPDEARVPSRAFRSGSEAYRLRTEELVKKWVKEIKLPNVLEPTLLVQPYFSKTNSVSTLLRYARETGAELIGASSHTKKRLERWLMGSFAEILSSHADVPVLVVNPRTPEPKSFDRVLFATDFSEASEKAFRRFLHSPLARKGKVTLFHAITYLPPETVAWMNAIPNLKEVVEQERKENSAIAERWCREAKTKGVKMDYLLTDKEGTVPEVILREAKRLKVGAIALPSRSGAFATALLGSIAHRVLREAHCPVWVLRPESEEGKSSFPLA